MSSLLSTPAITFHPFLSSSLFFVNLATLFRILPLLLFLGSHIVSCHSSPQFLSFPLCSSAMCYFPWQWCYTLSFSRGPFLVASGNLCARYVCTWKHTGGSVVHRTREWRNLSSRNCSSMVVHSYSPLLSLTSARTLVPFLSNVSNRRQWKHVYAYLLRRYYSAVLFTCSSSHGTLLTFAY